jgi:dTDP-4-amino-4,6-dideoxygalactose transaminase
MTALAAAGIDCVVYYPRALHEQPAYARWARGPLPQSERAAAEVLSLPVHPWLSEGEIERVATTLAAVT